jgi:hypothetical protein
LRQLVRCDPGHSMWTHLSAEMAASAATFGDSSWTTDV